MTYSRVADPLGDALRAVVTLTPIHSDRLGAPRSYLAEGGTWPTGPYRPDAPAATMVVADLIGAVLTQMSKRNWSPAALGAASGIGLERLYRLLSGEEWPDLDAIVSLERALAVRLWPEPPA
jgi:hypothetical protein